MTNVDKTYTEYVKARAEFWATHDRLVSEGVINVEDHPDLVAADQAVSDAYQRHLNSED